MMADAAKRITVEPPFDQIVGQSQVTRFLSEANRTGRLTHAYLFAGPVGSGKTETALALAKAKICPKGGCGECDACRRVARKTHPDVHWVEPEGVGSYLAEQIREVIRDCARTPIRANHKVYIVTRADLLRDAAANTFLKTLEEPPANTSFILMARTRESVLPTLVSRCQTLVFRRLPDEESVGLVQRMSGASEQDVRIALATVGGSTKGACEFLASPSRREARMRMVDALERLGVADSRDVLEMAAGVVAGAKDPQAELEARYAEQRRDNEEFMSRSALKALERAQERKLKSSTREALLESLAVARSWIRDCAACGIGQSELMVNVDCHYTIRKVGAELDPIRFIKAEKAIDRAAERIAYNVTPQLVFEAMLFEIREVLYASRSAGQVQI